MSPLEPDPPPAGEEVHVPGPSILPLLTAVGVTLIVIGITIFLVLTAVGIILTVICGILWIRDTRREMDELPLEHHH